MTRGLCSFLLACSFCGQAALLSKDLIQTTGEPAVAAGCFYGYRSVDEGPGDDAFRKAQRKAESEHVPLVVIWSNEDCHYCNAFISTLNARADDVKAWLRDTRAVFAFFEDRSGTRAPSRGHVPVACYEAWSFCSQTCHAQPAWPLIAFSYRLPDGTRLTKGFFAEPTDGEKNLTFLQNQYADWLQANGQGVSFTVSDTDGDRLEAEPTTRQVFVPVRRGALALSEEEVGFVTATFPNGAVLTNRIDWTTGESNHVVRLDLEATGYRPVPGGRIRLAYCAANVTRATGVIHCVAPSPNSPENPHFVGEKSMEDLDWADWTLDWDMATNKVARWNAAGTNAVTLAVYLGTLWCPDCRRLEQTLLADDRFARWLRRNHVQLVQFDQALSAKDAFPGAAHLLSWEAGEEHFNSKGDRARVSGAAYLSRHGLSADDAVVRAVADRARRFSEIDWKTPELTAMRLTTPTFLLIGGEGRVLGRLALWTDAQGLYSVDENLGRLNDLLDLRNRQNENGDFRSLTEQVYAVGTDCSVSLQVNAPTAWYRLTGLEIGRVELSVAHSAAKQVELAYYRAGNLVKRKTDTLTLNIGRVDLESSETFLRVSAVDDGGPCFADGATTSLFEASLSSVWTQQDGPIPIEEAGELNPYYRQAMNTVVDLLRSDADGRIVGQAAVSATRGGRVCVRIADASTHTVSLNGTWASVMEDGTLVATWTHGRTDYVVTLDPCGLVAVEIRDENSESVVSGWSDLSVDLDGVAYAGVYHVTLPVMEECGASVWGGTGYLVLSMTSAAAYLRGRMTYAGRMPDGTAFSGSGILRPDSCDPAEYAQLSVFRTVGRNRLAVALRIRRNGGAHDHRDSLSLRTVGSPEGRVGVWTHDGANGEEETELEVYGGWYRTGTTAAEWMTTFGLGATADLVIDSTGCAVSQQHGEMVTVPTGTLTARGGAFRLTEKTGRLSFSISRQTGVFNGTAQLGFSDGRRITARYYGLLLPGWTNCGCGLELTERPFGSGVLVFPDIVNRRRISHGVSVDLVVQ